VHHPQVGDLELRYDKFVISGAEDQLLVIYQAEPASRSAEALSLLSAISGDLADADSSESATALAHHEDGRRFRRTHPLN
jgi:hypothetical protein